MSTTRSLSAFLSSCDHLLERAHYLARLQKQLNRELPDDLSRHCRVQNLREGTLFLQTDSAVWANRLRYIVPTLLQKLQTRVAHESLRSIQVEVVPEQSTPPTPRRRAKLSAAAAQLLLENAEATTDPQLRAALHRLARHAKKDD